MELNTEPEVLIIGAGVFGISTAHHLAKRSPNPSSITILDRAPPPSGDAASTDINKIVRADYSSPIYMDLAFEAIEAWKNNHLFANVGVYHQSGWIAMNERGSDLAERIRHNFKTSGRPDPTRDMTEEEVRRSWGGILKDANMDAFESYYFNPSAGWADAGSAVKIMAEEAIRLGVQYKVGKARRLVLDDHGVKGVQTSTGEIYTAKKIVLATGAWTSQLMVSTEDDLEMTGKARMESQLTAAGICVAHFQLSPQERSLYDQLPVYVYGEEGEAFPPTASGLLKFTNTASFKNTIQTESGHTISVPPPKDQRDVPEALRREFLESIRGRLPQLFTQDRQVNYYRLCWDAITPEQHPLITQHPHPQLPNLYLAVGGSFHCWKFLPTVGHYVANVVHGVGNGADRDKIWGWKEEQQGRGVHDSLIPDRELRDY
ncbi:uncharacterized protein N7483_006215 [Penicillium malachiteum]|uniref:uncharacterized protein n=1 Tax=Penicillium malachiteum TaxID=1324776 RepID=UPI0025493CEF|nr:uncharacterized protein N7483_006215 [Penicillium malachiteum]KAJ5731707.1 hypothetical protein N7483_006215 [Penicillium malachiteum]